MTDVMIRPAFTSKYDEGSEKKDKRFKFTVILNEEEKLMFDEMRLWIQQSKPSTAIKQWSMYAYLTKVRPDRSETYLRDLLFKNERNNKRLGIAVETEI